MRNILIMLTRMLILGFVLLFCFGFFNVKAIAGDYVYKPAVTGGAGGLEEEDEDSNFRARGPALEQYFLERKKKKKKGGTGNSEELPPPPPCEIPTCTVQDPILGDEVCNNDCLQGSGWHCQGRHDWTVHQLYALCVPD